MALRLIVIVVALAACHATPLWFVEDGPVPGTVVYREGRDLFEPPQLAFGYGHAFSSKIGGITHSNSFGTSYEYGGGQAAGIGTAGANAPDGNVYAKGEGYANVAPSAPSVYRATYPYAYSPYDALYAYRRNGAIFPPHVQNSAAYPSAQNGATFPSAQNGAAIPLAQNGAAIPSAQNGVTLPSAQNNGQGTSLAQAVNGDFGSFANAVHQSGIASAQSIKGLGTVSSAASNGYSHAVAFSRDGQGTAFSTALGRDGLGYNTAAASSTQDGDFKSSIAQTIQHNADGVQQSAASSVNGPGIQSATASNNNN